MRSTLTTLVAALAILATACGSSDTFPPEGSSHTGRIVVERACADLGGFDDIPALRPILRGADGTALAAFIPSSMNGSTEADSINNMLGNDPSCPNVYTLDAEEIPNLPLYEIDAGRRGTFVITRAELEATAEPSLIDEERTTYLWFDLTIG